MAKNVKINGVTYESARGMLKLDMEGVEIEY